MAYPSIYDDATTLKLFRRLDSLSAQTAGLWGKMSIAQMLKHCAIPYKPIMDNKVVQKGPWYIRIIARLFFKKSMVNEVDYPHNLPTAKHFIIHDQPDFSSSRELLKNAIRESHAKGEAFMKAERIPGSDNLLLVNGATYCTSTSITTSGSLVPDYS
jgi:hypothetical protein